MLNIYQTYIYAIWPIKYYLLTLNKTLFKCFTKFSFNKSFVQSDILSKLKL